MSNLSGMNSKYDCKYWISKIQKDTSGRYSLEIINKNEFLKNGEVLNSFVEGVYLQVGGTVDFQVDYEIKDNKIFIYFDEMFIVDSASNTFFSFAIYINIRLQNICYKHFVLLDEKECGTLEMEVNERKYYFVKKNIFEYYFTDSQVSHERYEDNTIVATNIIQERDSITLTLKAISLTKDLGPVQLMLKNRNKKHQVVIGKPVNLCDGIFSYKFDKKELDPLLTCELNNYIFDLYVVDASSNEITMVKFNSNNLTVFLQSNLVCFYRNKFNCISVKIDDGVLCKVINHNQTHDELEMQWVVSKENLPEIKYFRFVLTCVKNMVDLIFPAVITGEDEEFYYITTSIDFNTINLSKLTMGTYEPQWFYEDMNTEEYVSKIKFDVLHTQSNKEFLPIRNVFRFQKFYYSMAWFLDVNNTLHFSVQEFRSEGKVISIIKDEKSIRIKGYLELEERVKELKRAFLLDKECVEYDVESTLINGEKAIEYTIEIPFSFLLQFNNNLFSFYIETELGALLLTDSKYIDKAMYKGYCIRNEQIILDDFYAGVYNFFYEAGRIKLRISRNSGISLFDVKQSRSGFKLFLNCLYELPNNTSMQMTNLLTNEVKDVPSIIDQTNVMVEIDKNRLTQMSEGAWKLEVVYNISGVEFRVGIVQEKGCTMMTPDKMHKYCLKLKGKLHSFLSSQGNMMHLEIRELNESEKYWTSRKSTLAKYIAYAIRMFKQKKVWLISENLGEVAQDNGFAFFKYCMENNISEEVYYVATKTNKHINKLLPYKKNVIYYDTFKHLIYYHLCQYLIVSHGIRDVLPSAYHKRMILNYKPIMYLQHGVIAMKRIGMNGDSYNKKIAKFVVSSQQERNIAIKQMGFQPDVATATGLARFDYAPEKREKKNHKILVMPTWRDWILYSKDEFKSSLYYKKYSELLTNHSLLEELRKRNVIIEFYPHIEVIKNYLDLFHQFENDVVKIAKPNEEDVAEALQSSDLLITDYSSVAFDFFYQEKPVLFYQFDCHDYMNYRGAYIGFVRELPGPICYASDELVENIVNYIDSNYKMEDKYEKRIANFFDHRDRENCKRIYDMIKGNAKK